MERWSQEVEACPPGQGQAHAFWHGSTLARRAVHVNLPDARVENLTSVVHRVGLAARLWSYQTVPIAPSAVE